VAFGPDGRLYVATGDAGNGPLAQRTDALNGKFLALSPEQYRGAGGTPAIVSLGHRNPQGFDWEPGTGRLIATEHGPTQGLDGPGGYNEINDIVRGATATRRGSASIGPGSALRCTRVQPDRAIRRPP
jgi:glucose/arabinose dehydrogenase